jgi:hypothetical protein
VPHYRIQLFKKLYQKDNIIVCHSKAKKGASLEESLEMDFENVVLQRLYFSKSQTAMGQRIGPVLKKYKPHIVITEFSLSYLTFWLLMIYKAIYKYKIIVWSHGVKNKEINKPFTTWKSKLQLWGFNRANAVVLYSEKRKNMLMSRIKDPGKLFVAYNTLDTEKLAGIYRTLKKTYRKANEKRFSLR